jgi:6-phosphogluconolactonase
MTNKKTIIIEPNAADLARKGAEMFTRAAKESAGLSGRFAVAISGGSTPRFMHRTLVEEPYLSDIPWQKTHIFWVDERCVPENDPASNYGAAIKDFLNMVPVPEAHVYPMPGKLSPEKGAQKYQKMLKDFFHMDAGRFPIFDLIFLGMGADGHTASLFPGDRALDENKRPVVAVKGGDPNVNRLTMTLPVLNRSRQIILLVSGKGKAATLKTVFEDDKARLPVQKIHAVDGELTWLLDREAASLLQGKMMAS